MHVEKWVDNTYKVQVYGLIHNAGVTSANNSSGHHAESLQPFPQPSALSLVNFANFNQRCADVALTQFMQETNFSRISL